MAIRKATVARSKLRMGLAGPSGSGKTFTSLLIATEIIAALRASGDLEGNGRVGLSDSEHHSAEKTAAADFDFDVDDLYDYSHVGYIKMIDQFEEQGYSFLILDSLSHEWCGKGGLLELHSRLTEEHAKKDGFATWGKISPLHNAVIDRILRSNMHIICTMRAKTKHTRSGNEVTKVGIRPIIRPETDYEFDVFGMMQAVGQTVDNATRTVHRLVITKSRCKPLDGRVFNDPDRGLARELAAWLSRGVAVSGESAPTLPPAQIARIMDLRNQLGVSADAFLKALTKYHVSRVEDLSWENSEVIVRNLVEKVRMMRAKEAAGVAVPAVGLPEKEERREEVKEVPSVDVDPSDNITLPSAPPVKAAEDTPLFDAANTTDVAKDRNADDLAGLNHVVDGIVASIETAKPAERLADPLDTLIGMVREAEATETEKPASRGRRKSAKTE